MMEKVFVTGAGGYVGSVLVPHLLSNGYRVLALDRFRKAPSLLCALCLNLEIVRGDVRDRDLVKDCLKGVDWIIHLAAVVGAPACDRDPYYAESTNLGAINELICVRSFNQGVIFPNTNSGYGTTRRGIICDETTELRPISVYGKTKALAEKALLATCINTISLRFATAFGASPRMRTDLLVNDFVYKAVTDKSVVLYEPHFRRNYIHVKDMARAFVHAMKNFDSMKGRAYNCGLPETLTKQQLCEKIKVKITDFQYFIASTGTDPDQRDYEVSNERLYKTGFVPMHSLEYGISELVKAYKTFPLSPYANA